MIKTIIFDMGGVLLPIDITGAINHFKELGVANAAQLLDSYTQTGIFGDLENGSISDEQFRIELSKLAGRELSWQECQYGWKGYFYLDGAPPAVLDCLKELRCKGYRLIMLSNTNPFIANWLFSEDFPGGQSLDKYFDAIYVSYKCHILKPDPAIFKLILDEEGLKADETLMVDDGPANIKGAVSVGMATFCPKNGEDWTGEIKTFL